MSDSEEMLIELIRLTREGKFPWKQSGEDQFYYIDTHYQVFLTQREKVEDFGVDTFLELVSWAGMTTTYRGAAVTNLFILADESLGVKMDEDSSKEKASSNFLSHLERTF